MDESPIEPAVISQEAKKKALAVNTLKLGLVAAAALFGKSEFESFRTDIQDMKVSAERVMIEKQNEPTNYDYQWDNPRLANPARPPSNLPEYHDGREFRPLKGLLEALFH